MDRKIEMEIDPRRTDVDQLIAKYAQYAREVYENRTAGDYTFTGIFSDFTTALLKLT